MSSLLTACAFAITLLFSPFSYSVEHNALNPGDTKFLFSGWQGPAFNVHVFVPETVTPATSIVIVMHGFSRDITRYYGDWRALGEQHGFIVVVPYLSKESFPGSNEYNLGHVFDAKTGKRRPESLWTYSAIEPLFDKIVAGLEGEQTQYTLYGHSAGSQFVHRFLYYKPEARVSRYIAANAGWYLMPDFNPKYPYGLRKSGLDKRDLQAALQKELIVLLGKEDTDPNDSDLRKTRQAKRQGKHRLERGQNMFKLAQKKADKLGKNLQWKLLLVDGAGHDNAAMARVAATLVK